MSRVPDDTVKYRPQGATRFRLIGGHVSHVVPAILMIDALHRHLEGRRTLHMGIRPGLVLIDPLIQHRTSTERLVSDREVTDPG
jgi:hypothetical protein